MLAPEDEQVAVGSECPISYGPRSIPCKEGSVFIGGEIKIPFLMNAQAKQP